MVVQSKNVTPRRSSISLSNNSQVKEDVRVSDLFNDYLKTFAVHRINMLKINSIIKPIIFFSSLFGMSMFGMFCIKEVVSKNLNLINVIIKTISSVIVCILFGCGTGIFFKWLLEKSRDTHTGSYIYVCLLSLIYSPVTLLLSWFFPQASNIINFVNAMFSTFIIEYNLIYDYQFLDSRSSFVLRILELIIIWIFLLVILPSIAH
jgi:H+/Cl- antiporter ClcA